jgi:F0F1-type ATP synthase assembly protein I
MHTSSSSPEPSGSAPEHSPAKNEESKKSGWAQFAKYSEIAFIFPAATVAGLFVGIALDHWLHTSWLSIAGLFVGILTGFVQLVRLGISAKSD